MNFETTIRAVQAKLGVTVDGKPGIKTWTVIHRAIIGETATVPEKTLIPSGSGRLSDDRSERHIATLLPEVRPLARALIERAAVAGIVIKVISGPISSGPRQACRIDACMETPQADHRSANLSIPNV